jgi:catechol 2,3-dioxygenase-like lactoylglutathione lyase family enzyme
MRKSRASARERSRTLLTGFDHVDLNVRDRAALRDFFRDALGMDVIGEGPDHTYLLFGDQVLGLHESEPGETRRVVLDHVGLRLGKAVDADQLFQRILRAGAKVARTKQRDDSWSAFVEVPGGIRIELVDRPRPHSHSHGPSRSHREGRGREQHD